MVLYITYPTWSISLIHPSCLDPTVDIYGSTSTSLPIPFCIVGLWYCMLYGFHLRIESLAKLAFHILFYFLLRRKPCVSKTCHLNYNYFFQFLLKFPTRSLGLLYPKKKNIVALSFGYVQYARLEPRLKYKC